MSDERLDAILADRLECSLKAVEAIICCQCQALGKDPNCKLSEAVYCSMVVPHILGIFIGQGAIFTLGSCLSGFPFFFFFFPFEVGLSAQLPLILLSYQGV